MRPVEMPVLDRFASGVVTAAPPIMLAIGMYFGWTGNLLNWQDLLILAVMYAGIGTGITVGFHRLLTHRSFKCSRLLRAGFAALGSAAAEGPVIDWVATHRRHHQYSDVDGDPHSPHLHGSGFTGALRGLVHAHLGWVFTDMEVADERRYAKDLLADPMIRFVNDTFVLWVIAGLAAAFGLGVALTGHRDRRSDRVAVGRGRPDLPDAPRDLQHQLPVSLLRPPRVRHRGSSRATSHGWRSRPGARRGTTTITRSRPRTATGFGAGSSTPPQRSSASSR